MDEAHKSYAALFGTLIATIITPKGFMAVFALLLTYLIFDGANTVAFFEFIGCNKVIWHDNQWLLWLVLVVFLSSVFFSIRYWRAYHIINKRFDAHALAQEQGLFAEDKAKTLQKK